MVNHRSSKISVQDKTSDNAYTRKIAQLLKGRFDILQNLGQGGMGRVYKATDIKNNRTVALKLVRPELSEDETILKRLKREMEVTSRTRSPHVVKTYELDRVEDTSFITMEFIDGETLADILKREDQLNTEITVSYALQILEGLKSAHEGQVIHRDLKPSNIMIDSSGKLVITDFGLAHPGGDVTKISKTASIIGTPQYIAPEQWKGLPPDAGTDIYAFGVILYEMLCGQTPFVSDTDFGYLQQHLNTPPPFKHQSLANLPAFLRQIILKCLEKSSEHRYSDVEKIIEDLTKCRVRGRASANIRRSFHKVPGKLWYIMLTILLLGSGYYVSDTYLIKKKPEKFHFAVLPFKKLSKEKKVVSWSKKLPNFISSSLSDEEKMTIIPYLQVRSKYGRKSVPEASEALFDNTNTDYIVSGDINKEKDKYVVNVKVFKRGGDKAFYSKQFKTEGKSLFAFNSRISRSIKEHLNIKVLTNNMIEELKNIHITANSLDALELYITGSNFHTKGNYFIAIKHLLNAIKLDKKLAMAYYKLSQCYNMLGYFDKQKKVIIIANKLSSNISSEEYKKIHLMFNSSFGKFNFREQLSLKKAAYIKSPNKLSAMLEYANLCYRYELWEEAIPLYISIDKNDKAPVVKRNLITSYAKSKQIKKAYNILSTVAEHKPLPNWFHFYNWTLAVLQQKFLEAIKIGKHRIFLHPEDEKSYRYTGLAYLFNEDFDEASNTFFQITKWTTSNLLVTKSLIYLACIKLHQGKMNEAEGFLTQCRSISKQNNLFENYVTSLRLLIKINLLKNKRLKAIKLYQLYCSITESRGEHIDLVMESYGAICYNMIDKKKEAQVILNKIKNLAHSTYNPSNKICVSIIHSLNSEDIDSLTRSYKIYRGEFSTFMDHHALILNIIANKHKERGSLKKALTNYELISKLTFGRIYYGEIFALSFYNAGCINQKLNNKSKARKQLITFLNLWKNGDRNILPQIADAERRLAELSR